MCLRTALEPAGQFLAIPFWQYQGLTSPSPTFGLNPFPSHTAQPQFLTDWTSTEVCVTFPRCLPYCCSVSEHATCQILFVPMPSLFWESDPALILPDQTTWVS